MRYLISCLLFLISTSSISKSLDEISNIKSLGKSEMGLWKNYVDLDTLKKCCDNKYVTAVIYTVHTVLQNGIDIYDDKGNRSYNTNLKTQSSAKSMLFDCDKKMVAILQKRYFKTAMPTGDIVYEIKEKSPFMVELKYFPEKSIFNFVCSYKLN
jgi:hypothetical protein